METEDFYPGLKRWEGSTDHLYLDVLGLPTTGIGNLVKTVETALSLPWFVGDRLATDAEVRRDWAAVKAAKPGKRASAYAGLTKIRLREQDIITIVADRLENEFLPGLRRLVPGFDETPDPAQECLVDMVYNLGVRGLSKFVKFLAAVNSRSWLAAAVGCKVKTSRPERNEWRRAQMETCAVRQETDT